MVLKMKEEESYAFIFLLRRWRHAIGCALIAFILVGNAGRCSKNVPELLLQRRLSYNSEQEAHLATKAATSSASAFCSSVLLGSPVSGRWRLGSARFLRLSIPDDINNMTFFRVCPLRPGRFRSKTKKSRGFLKLESFLKIVLVLS